MIASLLIIGTSTLVGMDISNKYRHRVSHLRLCIQSLQLLETEMEYSQTTLKDIFEKLSHNYLFPLSLFYERLNNLLSTNIDDFFEMWCEQVELLHHITALQEQDLVILKQVGKYIGMYHLYQQKKQIQLSIHYLESQLDEAIDKHRKFGKMSIILGILIGVLIVILLF